jgi:hypothetical protein
MTAVDKDTEAVAGVRDFSSKTNCERGGSQWSQPISKTHLVFGLTVVTRNAHNTSKCEQNNKVTRNEIELERRP